jgi:hypothetical protein
MAEAATCRPLHVEFVLGRIGTGTGISPGTSLLQAPVLRTHT